ncbi:MAG: hypothetical protein P8016_04250 [Sedimentisphaerales bacterium]
MHGAKEKSDSKIIKLSIAAILTFALSSCSKQHDTSMVSTYKFVTEQSSVTQTGGLAGVHETYPIEGSFQLSVNYDANTASFERVDANMTESTGFLPTQNLNELFNMTKLKGVINNNTAIVFTGKTSEPESTVSITVVLADDTVTMKGGTTPPQGSADFFIFNLDAFAKKE